MTTEIKGRIFNIQSFSVQDGPGIRVTVFFKGCPLRCQWCANPEGISTREEIGFRAELCNGCNVCIEVCPTGAIASGNGSVRLQRAMCNRCGRCAEVCSAGAIIRWGKEVTPEGLVETVMKDQLFFRNSGGGVTISGGEALRQWRFLQPFLKLCRVAGLHTCVDTSGFCEQPVIEAVAGDADLFLYDIKHMDSLVHQRLTGHGNERILLNARLLANRGAEIIVRVPLVPGVNDSETNITRTCEFARELKSVTRIDLLPYHRWGVSKYKALGRRYLLGNVPGCSDETVKKAQTVISERFNFECQVGG